MKEFSPAWFDAASKEWMKNKRRVHSAYRYTCEQQFKSGKRCGRDVYKTESLCRQYWALFNNVKEKSLPI
jgi:hypothetical protein